MYMNRQPHVLNIIVSYLEGADGYMVNDGYMVTMASRKGPAKQTVCKDSALVQETIEAWLTEWRET